VTNKQLNYPNNLIAQPITQLPKDLISHPPNHCQQKIIFIIVDLNYSGILAYLIKLNKSLYHV